MNKILLAIGLISTVAASAYSTSAFADDITSCKQGKLERKVSLVYPESGKKAPCEVHYIKESDDKVIFKAQNEAGYCEKRKEDFITKLKAGGFSCDGVAQAAPPGGTAAAVEAPSSTH